MISKIITPSSHYYHLLTWHFKNRFLPQWANSLTVVSAWLSEHFILNIEARSLFLCSAPELKTDFAKHKTKWDSLKIWFPTSYYKVFCFFPTFSWNDLKTRLDLGSIFCDKPTSLSNRDPPWDWKKCFYVDCHKQNKNNF